VEGETKAAIASCAYENLLSLDFCAVRFSLDTIFPLGNVWFLSPLFLRSRTWLSILKRRVGIDEPLLGELGWGLPS